MAMEATVLINTANRLGVYEENALKKTEEFSRVLQNKGAIKSLNATAKTVLCLDLATNLLGINFDKVQAIKLSGLTKPQYKNQLNVLEQILELNKPLTIQEVCVLNGVAEVKDLSQEIWEKYQKTQNLKPNELTHPQYVTAVVYTTCKLKRIKVQKNKFIELSRLKPAQFKDLTNKFQNIITKLGFTNKKREKIVNEIDELAQELDNVMMDNEPEDLIEDYQVWRERILKEAFNELEAQQ